MHYNLPTDTFIKVVNQIENDLVILNSLLDLKIDELLSDPIKSRSLFSSVFSVYDIGSGHGSLAVYNVSSTEINISNIDGRKKSAFQWISSLTIVRAYNSLELLLLATIYEELMQKKATNFDRQKINEVKQFIKRNLNKFDSKNNRYILEFYISNSEKAKHFLNQNIRIDLNSTWLQFFNLITILRHVLVHNAMLIDRDTLNTIKSCGKTLYDRFLEPELKVGEFTELQIQPHQLTGLLQFITDLGLNLVKFLKNEKDLRFAGFEKA